MPNPCTIFPCYSLCKISRKDIFFTLFEILSLFLTILCIEQIFDSRFLLRENRTDRVHDQVLFNLNSLMKKLYLMEPKPNVELHTFKDILLMHSYNTYIFF